MENRRGRTGPSDIIATKSFDIHLDLIWFLIPMVLFRKFFERHFIRGIPRDVEMNLSVWLSVGNANQ